MKIVKVVKECPENLTQMNSQKSCDVNVIMKQFRKTGQIIHLAKKVPFYGDVSDFTDYGTALMKVKVAQDLFEQMPSAVRNRFDNDVEKAIKFLEDPKNLKEAQEIGMVEKPTIVNKEPIVAPEAKTGDGK